MSGFSASPRGSRAVVTAGASGIGRAIVGTNVTEFFCSELGRAISGQAICVDANVVNIRWETT